MPFTLRSYLALPLVLLTLVLSGCIESDSPILASGATDTIPLRDGFYFDDNTAFFIRTYDAKQLIVNVVDDSIAYDAIMKDLGNNFYLVQYGHLSEKERQYVLLRLAADGNGMAIRAPDCDGADAAAFARAGVTVSKALFGCDVGAATPAALVRAFRDIAQSSAQVKWQRNMVYDGSSAALRKFEQLSIPKVKP